MFRGSGVQEKVSVVGTAAFIEFVEGIKKEGVEIDYAPMGPGTTGKTPLIIEVDRENKKKNIDALDIKLPILQARIARDYKNLHELNVANFNFQPAKIISFSEAQQRDIVFREIVDGEISHTTQMDGNLEISPQNVIGFFAQNISRELRLVGANDVLFGKVKQFITGHLFGKEVEIADPNILRNLSESVTKSRIYETFKGEINKLTVRDSGTTRISSHIKLSEARPVVVNDQPVLYPKRSIFNKVVGNNLELDFASFLDDAKDILSFARNRQRDGLSIEYQPSSGGIATYVPDYIVKERDDSIWIIETKGREDIEDPRKIARLQDWCKDATAHDGKIKYQAMFVREEDFKKYQPTKFSQANELFVKKK